MNNVSNSYKGDSFLDWYKNNWGIDFDQNKGLQRKAEINDDDWNYGNLLYQYYLSENNIDNQHNSNKDSLLKNYQNSNEALATNKRKAEQNASITFDKLKKYLPIQIKAQGLGGLGLSESTLLQAYNNYNNTMSQIAGNYNEQKTKLSNNYSNDISALENAYGTNKTDLALNKNADILKLQENYSDRPVASDVARGILDDLISQEDYSKAKKFLEENRSILGDSYDVYLSNIAIEEEKTNEANAESEKNTIDSNILEGKQYVKYQGNNYQIKSQLKTDANEIRRNNDFKEKLKDIGFTDPYDSNIPNGTTITIKSDNSGSNEFNWKDIVSWLIPTSGKALIPGYNIYDAINNNANLETRNVTYYNGSWYLSDKV